jgi:MFS family permease
MAADADREVAETGVGLEPSEPVEPSARGGTFASLRHRDYAVFWTAALTSNIGTWMQTVTVPFLLDRLTHSASVVGLGVFLTFFPQVIVGPIAGSIADRYSRRTILLWAQGLMMVVAFVMWALVVTGSATALALLLCVTVVGTANGMSLPAWFAFVTQLVPREDMLNAVRLNILQVQSARAIGPGLAGLVLATLGPGAAFFINGLSFVVVIVAVLSIPARGIGQSAPDGRLWELFRAGVRYVRHSSVLAVATVTIFVFGFFGQSVVQLIEPFTHHTLHLGAGQYGVVVAAFGIGAVGGSLITAYWDAWRRSSSFACAAVLVIVSEVAFALAPGFWAAVAVMVLFGMAWTICQSTLQTVMQANVDELHRGRVTSIYLTSFSAGFPLGALVGGFGGDIFGLRITFVAAAVALAIFTVTMSMAYQRLRLFDRALDLDLH